MTIDDNGRVGIGTTSPQTVLNVLGSASGEVFRISSPRNYTIGNGPMMVFSELVNGEQVAGIKGSFSQNNNGNYGKLEFLTRTSDALGIETKMTILNNGNVGIGTTDATSKLTVMSPSEGTSGSPYRIFAIRNPAPTGQPDQFAVEFELGKTHILNPRGNDLIINRAGGNVGIGTTTTGTCKLAVEGKIGAREVIVQATGWPDFVFDESYKLAALDEVEQSIKTNISRVFPQKKKWQKMV